MIPPVGPVITTHDIEVQHSWFNPCAGHREYTWGRRRSARWVEDGKEMAMWWWVGEDNVGAALGGNDGMEEER